MPLTATVRRDVVGRFPFCILYRDRDEEVFVMLVAPTQAAPAAARRILDLVDDLDPEGAVLPSVRWQELD
jgi:hypothetical protein